MTKAVTLMVVYIYISRVLQKMYSQKMLHSKFKECAY